MIALATLALAAHAAVLPYPVAKKTLPNGLDVIVIETPEFKNVLSYNTLVLSGSGKEYEKGKTGLAHLFEHILFRHRINGEEGAYEEAMNKLGTHNNAWTWFDITYYHPLTFSSNLEKLADLESARFKGLDFSEKTFQTESGAVLGEYRRGASQPTEKLEERLAALMFPGHPYGHTTMGYLEDVQDMPNHFEAAKKFYDEHYRPDGCALIVAGDVKAGEVFKVAESRYKDWKPKEWQAPKLALDFPKKEQREKVTWDADVAPIVWVAYRMPAFQPGSPASAAAEVLSELLVSPAAPLYKKLRYEKQTASALELAEGTQGFESFEPRALVVSAELDKEKFGKKDTSEETISDVVAALDELKSFSKQPGAADLLKTVKSKYRYDFLAQLKSPEQIASTFAWYYRFGKDVKALDKLLASVDALKPEDVDRLAAAQFTPENRVVLTLSYEPGAKKGK